MGFSREVSDVVGNAVAEMGRRKRYNRWNISLSELLKDERVQNVPLQAPENANLLRSMLYEYGVDIDKHYEVETIEHRNVFGEVVVCPYFLGIERTDQTWQLKKDGLLRGTWKV